MGQRLNIEIKKGDQLLANCYYHWSGYSESSLLLTKKIIDEFEDIKEENDLIRAIMLLQLTGAGITRPTLGYLLKNIPNFDMEEEVYTDNPFGEYKIHFSRDRNEGLIEVTEERMKETRSWEEGRITIHIDTKTFDFDVIWKYESEADKKEWEGCYEKKIKDLPTLEFPFENIEFEQIDNMLSMVENIKANSKGHFKDSNGVVYSLIW